MPPQHALAGNPDLLQHILSHLPPAGLAAAEATCSRWRAVIGSRALWHEPAQRLSIEPPATTPPPAAAAAAAAGGPDTTTATTTDPWRTACLQAAVCAKFAAGRLLLSATLDGHAAAVACLAHVGGTLISGSRDGTACIWDLEHGTRCHVLIMPQRQPVAAVALPSVALAVTLCAPGSSGSAAAGAAAVLWREGRAVRRFEVVPGGVPSTLSLTDTRVLVGSSSGVLQHFDLFSGSQQLMTRHGSGVSCVLPVRCWRHAAAGEQHAAAAQAAAAAGGLGQEDWQLIVGCHDGQVSCLSGSTGALVWQLPTRFPSRIVAMEVQQQQQPEDHHAVRPRQLLLVLNVRSQVVCWELPSPPQPAAARSRDSSRRQLSAHRAPTNDAQPPTLPLCVCNLVPPAAPAAAAAQATATPEADADAVAAPLAGLAPASRPATTQPSRLRMPGWQGLRPHGSTCMLVPELAGGQCLLVGSSLGSIAVLQLTRSAGRPGNGDGAAADSAAAVPAPAVAAQQAGHDGAAACPQPLQQQPADQAPPGVHLMLRREHHLHKLGKMLSERSLVAAATAAAATAAATAAAAAARARHTIATPGSTTESSLGEAPQQPPSSAAEASSVLCMCLTEEGKVVVGLASGHIAVLRFKHAAGSVWTAA